MPLRCPTGLVPDDERLSQGRRLDPLARRSALIRSTFSFSAAAQIASSSFVLARASTVQPWRCSTKSSQELLSLAPQTSVRPFDDALVDTLDSRLADLPGRREKRGALLRRAGDDAGSRLSKRAQSFGAERELALGVATPHARLAQTLKREQKERLVVQIS